MRTILLSILFIGAILVCSENRMAVQAESRGEGSNIPRTLLLMGTKG